MMKYLTVLLLMLRVAALAQPTTKKTIVEGEGSPVVLLHGGTADLSTFSAHSKELSQHYKVIRMEQFNVQYAEEGRVLPNNYSIKMESEAIKGTLDSLLVKEPVVLVGHSYGGLVALDFALNHPDYVSSLVLIEPPFFQIAESWGQSPQGMKEMKELSKQFTPQAEITEDMVMQFRCELMNCDTFDIRHHPLWNIWLQQKNRLRGLSEVNHYQVNLNKLPHFQNPVLIVTGTQTVPFHKRIDELLEAEFPHAKAASLTGGHTAVNTNPHEFVQLLEKFLGK
jgi:pimeloyl-ACP methyl ester carboxylesterase